MRTEITTAERAIEAAEFALGLAHASGHPRQLLHARRAYAKAMAGQPVAPKPGPVSGPEKQPTPATAQPATKTQYFTVVKDEKGQCHCVETQEVDPASSGATPSSLTHICLARSLGLPIGWRPELSDTPALTPDPILTRF